MKLQIAGFLENSLVNGEGMRAVVFVAGCKHNCSNCQNQFMQDFKYGDSVQIHSILEKIKKNIPIIKGVTFSGGEPFESAAGLSELSQEIKTEGLNIWCYTGYTFEELIYSDDEDKLKLLTYIDVLIDGKFDETLKEGAMKYTGSSNQRIIDVRESVLHNRIILWNKSH